MASNWKSKLCWLAFSMATAVAPVAAEDITITSWGGSLTDSEREAFYKPFAAQTNIKVLEDVWDGNVAKLRAMSEAGKATWDIVVVEPVHALLGCSEEFLEKIDYAAIGGAEKFVKGSAMECAAGAIVASDILAYNAEKFPDGGPKTFADFFDLEKFPGPRALRKHPRVTLEWALLADGVAVDKLYETLATPEGVAKAFAKLDKIKPSVKVWWEAGAQPPQLLADGEVIMSSAWNGRIDAARKEGKKLVVIWDGQAMDFNLWAIPKGSAHVDAATKFIAFATQPEIAATQANYISYAPAVADAIKHVPAEISANLPTSPDNLKGLHFVVDAAFWADHGDDLVQQFNAWLAK